MLNRRLVTLAVVVGFTHFAFFSLFCGGLDPTRGGWVLVDCSTFPVVGTIQRLYRLFCYIHVLYRGCVFGMQKMTRLEVLPTRTE
jgi:hypothetical protein